MVQCPQTFKQGPSGHHPWVPRTCHLSCLHGPLEYRLLSATFQTSLGHGFLSEAAHGPDPHETSWSHCSGLLLVPCWHYQGGVDGSPLLEG